MKFENKLFSNRICAFRRKKRAANLLHKTGTIALYKKGMVIKMEDKEFIAGAGENAKSPFALKLENFWYHYKCHTIAALFAVIVLTVVTLQMCTKTEYDVHITYAGNYEIKKTGAGVSPYGEAVKSLAKVTEDFDGDGQINVDFTNLFVVNEEERDALLGGNSKLEINETLVREDTKTLDSSIIYGDYYIFLLSERLFKEYESELEGQLFASLSSYEKEGKSYEYASEEKTGIYLRSLGISSLPTLSELPEDTVVCMRALSPVSSVFGKKENEKNFERSETVMRNILAFE